MYVVVICNVFGCRFLMSDPQLSLFANFEMDFTWPGTILAGLEAFLSDRKCLLVSSSQKGPRSVKGCLSVPSHYRYIGKMSPGRRKGLADNFEVAVNKWKVCDQCTKTNSGGSLFPGYEHDLTLTQPAFQKAGKST